MTLSKSVPKSTSEKDAADDPVLLAAVQEYLTLLDAGEAPDRREFSRRFPAVAEALEKCLAGLEAMHVAAGTRKPPRPTSTVPTGTIEPHLSKPLGDFQILREIGRGGMGVVYEAQQLSLGRKVALKVLPFAATFDAKHLQRFRNEAQAAAQLHHNNIVPVFAVGCERGVHFYAMQLIDGQSLSVLIDQFRRREGMRGMPSAVDQDATTRPEGEVGITAAPPAPATAPPTAVGPVTSFAGSLSTQHAGQKKDYFRSVARLFVMAAHGLDHAHQVGIVHRDVKPGNLLVDARGNLWITDFGLAQFRSETHLTRTGDLVGTLRYMSPEQAAGQRAVLDHRSDIYSLGATLYEMATLEPIFDGPDSIALIRQISHDDPVPPRHLDPAIPVELETIILKAVSKAPAERYTSALEMAADLQRFLDDQPILARRPTVADRVRKWTRRHPAAVLVALGFLLAAVIGLTVSNRLISNEQERTRTALEGQQERADEAERRFAQARQSVDLLIKVAEDELAAQPQLLAARKKVLLTALAFYQDLIDQRADSPESQAELTRDQARVRQILSDLSTLEGAHRLDLLLEPSVQADLQLMEEQRLRAVEFAQSWSDQRFAFFRDARNLPYDQRQAQFVGLIRVHDESLAGLLSAEQLARLKQISLQTKGLFAFEDADVIAALGLTPPQKSKIREIHGEVISVLFERPFEKGPFGPFEKKFDFVPGGPAGKGPPKKDDRGKDGPEKGPDFRPREQAAHRAGVERVLGILTAEQRQRWSALVGPAFVGSIRTSPAGMPMPKDGPRVRP